MNGHSSMSLESDISTMSSETQSIASQETTIIRETHDENTKSNETKTHSRGLSVAQSTHMHRYDKLQPNEIRDIFLIFLFVVKYLGEEQLISLWQKCAEMDVVNFFSVLEMCLYCFKYVGKRNVVVKSASTDNNKSKPAKAHTLPARMNPSEINHENTGTLVIHTPNRENLITSGKFFFCTFSYSIAYFLFKIAENEECRKQQATLEQNLANEVALITLDCMGLYCMHFRNNLLNGDGDNLTMKKIFDIYITFIQIGQSETVYKHVFASLRAFINNYSSLIFQGNHLLFLYNSFLSFTSSCFLQVTLYYADDYVTNC